jgi:hypothetical protein
MMSVNREIQRKILVALRDHYPEEVQLHKLALDCDDEQELQFNAFYLKEHGLIEGKERRVMSAPRSMILAKISASGLDFLEGDGGLTAILNTVTVKFDVESVKKLVEEKILQSSIPQEEKETILKKLRHFSGNVSTELMTSLILKGIEHPATWAVILEVLTRLT